MCFLLWEGNGATDLKHDTPQGYASFINLGLEYKAHIIGPCIAGAPNDYPEMNAPWQAYLIKKSECACEKVTCICCSVIPGISIYFISAPSATDFFVVECQC